MELLTFFFLQTSMLIRLRSDNFASENTYYDAKNYVHAKMWIMYMKICQIVKKKKLYIYYAEKLARKYSLILKITI